MASQKTSGGRIGGGTFPRIALASGLGTWLLWCLATYGALKPQTHVENLTIHNHASAPTRPASPAAPAVQIQVAPAQVFVMGADASTAQVIEKELQARQQMVTAASSELAGELNRPGARGIISHSGAPTDGWWASDCEDNPELMPLSQKTKFRSVEQAAKARQRQLSDVVRSHRRR